MNKCIHELELNTCSLCKEPPAGVPKIVYVTKLGRAYHSRATCEYLSSGHDWAQEKGQNNHPITPVQWSVAYLEYEPCLLCFRGNNALLLGKLKKPK